MLEKKCGKELGYREAKGFLLDFEVLYLHCEWSQIEVQKPVIFVAINVRVNYRASKRKEWLESLQKSCTVMHLKSYVDTGRKWREGNSSWVSVRCRESLIRVEMLTRTEPTFRRWKWKRYTQCCIKEAAGCGRGWMVCLCFQGFWVWGGRCDRSWSPFTSNYPLSLFLHHKDVLQDCRPHCTAWSWLFFQLFLCLVPPLF